MSEWKDKETGETVSRIQIVKNFELETGVTLSAEEFQTLLDQLSTYEQGQDND